MASEEDQRQEPAAAPVTEVTEGMAQVHTDAEAAAPEPAPDAPIDERAIVDQPDQLDQPPVDDDLSTPTDVDLGLDEPAQAVEPDDDGPGGPGLGDGQVAGVDFRLDTSDVGEEQLLVDPAAELDGPVEHSDVTAHERALFDDVANDGLDGDPASLDRGVPDEYDLSGDEAGDDSDAGPDAGPGAAGDDDTPVLLELIQWFADSGKEDGADAGPSGPGGPVQGNPMPGMVYVEGSGYVTPEQAAKMGEAGENDMTTVKKQRAEALAEGSTDDDGTVTDTGGAEVYSWQQFFKWASGEDLDDFEKDPNADDYDPDGGGKVFTTPSMDPAIAETYFGIGEAADRNAEVQFADHPDGGDAYYGDYDGIDYGEEQTAPNFDVHEADALLTGDPFGQPDVDPAYRDDDADSGRDADDGELMVDG